MTDGNPSVARAGFGRPGVIVPALRIALVTLIVAVAGRAEGQGVGPVASIELVALPVAGASDTTTVLPDAITTVPSGAAFVVEVWASTTGPQGLSSVSATIQFDPTLANVAGVAHTALFPDLTRADVNNAAGWVANLSGSHLGTCADQIGVGPNWARVAVLDVQAGATGTLTVQAGETGSPALGTSLCGVGDLPSTQIAYGAATITIAGPPIPTASQWGLVILTGLLLAAGTLVLKRRSCGKAV